MQTPQETFSVSERRTRHATTTRLQLPFYFEYIRHYQWNRGGNRRGVVTSESSVFIVEDSAGGYWLMGAEGLDSSPETSCFVALFGMGDAESEAIGKDATLRDLVRLWSKVSSKPSSRLFAGRLANRLEVLLHSI